MGSLSDALQDHVDYLNDDQPRVSTRQVSNILGMAQCVGSEFVEPSGPQYWGSLSCLLYNLMLGILALLWCVALCGAGTQPKLEPRRY